MVYLYLIGLKKGFPKSNPTLFVYVYFLSKILCPSLHTGVHNGVKFTYRCCCGVKFLKGNNPTIKNAQRSSRLYRRCTSGHLKF